MMDGIPSKVNVPLQIVSKSCVTFFLWKVSNPRLVFFLWKVSNPVLISLLFFLWIVSYPKPMFFLWKVSNPGHSTKIARGLDGYTDIS